MKRDIKALNKADKQDDATDMGDYVSPRINGVILRFVPMGEAITQVNLAGDDCAKYGLYRRHGKYYRLSHY